MKDYIVKVTSPMDGIEIKLYKKGLEKLEHTRDKTGASFLDKLFFILSSMGGDRHTWKDVENYSEQGKQIFDLYLSAYSL